MWTILVLFPDLHLHSHLRLLRLVVEVSAIPVYGEAGTEATGKAKLRCSGCGT